MRRLANFSTIIVATLSVLALHAAAQVGDKTVVSRRIPILDAQGNAVATIRITRGTLSIVDVNGKELFTSSQASTHAALPALSPPVLGGGKADDFDTLRADIDVLAASVTTLTERVTELSNR